MQSIHNTCAHARVQATHLHNTHTYIHTCTRTHTYTYTRMHTYTHTHPRCHTSILYIYRRFVVSACLYVVLIIYRQAYNFVTKHLAYRCKLNECMLLYMDRGWEILYYVDVSVFVLCGLICSGIWSLHRTSNNCNW